MHQDMVDKIQFTTKALYQVLHPLKKKALWKCYLKDPQYPLPESIPDGLDEMPSLGDYVEVVASSIKDQQAGAKEKRYKYSPTDNLILTTKWKSLDEAQTHTHTHTQCAHAHTHKHTHTVTNTQPPPTGHVRG
jgi:ABC-type nickel/cobalt efflux system permease component RcnA